MNMNTIDEITKRIYDRSDRELKGRIEQSVKWIWDEITQGVNRPGPDQLAEVNAAAPGGIPTFKEMPWIGGVLCLWKAVAFAYLRDKYRQQAISAFMEKVEAISQMVDEGQ